MFSLSLAQQGTVKGKIINPENRSISNVVIEVQETQVKSRSRNDGTYQISLDPGTYTIQFTHPTHQKAQLYLEVKAGYTYDKPIKMLELTLDEAVITDDFINEKLGMQPIPIKAEDLVLMPSFNRSVEAVMKNMPGVASNNEFSSQYQVRGGNFDENLVYVNGIEIYRPFLTRSGQQEGLGFANPDMTQNIQFSTGGFPAQYGDKLSSVLDITYREPESFKGTAELGFITATLHVEGSNQTEGLDPDKGKFTYLLGGRRFSTTYLLNSLDTRGEYRPNFLDFQGLFTFTPKSSNKSVRYRLEGNDTTAVRYFPVDKLKLTTFISASRNRYLFEPSARETTFGTINQAFRLRTAFEGRETSSYTTGLGAVKLTYRPSLKLGFDYIFTVFYTEESELFDIEGGYLLGEVNTSFGSDEFNESDFDLGVGSELRHARNYLTATVFSGQVNGYWYPGEKQNHKLVFGIKAQQQYIDDNLKEYILLDSAGYVVNEFSQFDVIEFIRGEAELNSSMLKTFFQHEWQLSGNKSLTTGARLVYYDLIDDWMFSPRIQFAYSPKLKDQSKELQLRLAAGVYQQPPFYREFRRFDGTLNLDIDPQRSIHGIIGLDYLFSAWGRPFRLFSEIYYKQLYDLIPYEVQNVRIRYYPDERADGFAYGWDARISGEFIKGVDSWISIGVLKTEEKILGNGGEFVPRPTDQRVTFSMYFQDELPVNPTYKVHVNYIFGSGMRFGPPRVFENRTAFDFPPYHRVDVGFSKLITFKPKAEAEKKHGLESIWATLEIFNLFQRENTVSYTWLQDLNNNQFAIPNFLSARLINLRVITRFR